MENIRRDDSRDDSNVRFSRRLAIILMAVVTVLVLVTGVTAVWISQAYNALSETDTKRMISGGISALDAKLQNITVDYSIWAAWRSLVRKGSGSA